MSKDQLNQKPKFMVEVSIIVLYSIRKQLIRKPLSFYPSTPLRLLIGGIVFILPFIQVVTVRILSRGCDGGFRKGYCDELNYSRDRRLSP